MIDSEVKSSEIYTPETPDEFLELYFSEDAHPEPCPSSGAGKFIRSIILLMIPIFFIFGLIAFIIHESPENRLKSLISQGRYQDCIFIADRMLHRSHENKSIAVIASDAIFEELFSKGWANHVREGRYEEARNFIIELARIIRYHDESRKMLSALNWIVDIEQFSFTESDKTHLVIFKDEYTIESLLSRWEKDKDYIRNVMNTLLTVSNQQSSNDPMAADALVQNVYRHFLILQHRKLVYVGIINDLKHSVQISLDNDPEKSLPIIAEFRKKYPIILGLDELEQDCSRYLKLDRAIKSEKWNDVADVLSNNRFVTPLVNEKISRILKQGQVDFVISKSGTPIIQNEWLTKIRVAFKEQKRR